MFTALLMSLAMVSADDPVPGYPDYIPRIGEAAIIHDYDPDLGKAHPDSQAWTNTTAFVKFNEAFFSEANERERAKLLGNPKAMDAFDTKVRRALLKESESRREVLYLPDMTPIKVRALACVDGEAFKDGIVYDAALAEVTGGTMTGRFFWVWLTAVRVPGAKPPAGMVGFDDIAPGVRFDAEPKPAPEPTPRPRPPLQVVETAWSRLSDFIKVDVRVKNTSDRDLEDILCSVVYRDVGGKLVSTGNIIFGDLRPGETKTLYAFDQAKPEIHHYGLEFTAREDGERHTVEFSRP